MFFGVFDFTFVVWMIVGATGVLVVLGANEWFKDRGIVMTWWKWLLLTVWYIAAMMAIAAPFTIMGEGEVSAGWRMLFMNSVILIISGVIVYRILTIGAQKQEASLEPPQEAPQEAS